MFVLYITVAVCCPCGVINDDDDMHNDMHRDDDDGLMGVTVAVMLVGDD